ncbi:unnamed protein product [Didymodactylos carnosus]|uniref:Uncharacterized protein n=1 Tax=Didymodactylos carnosus TaxID=1234261 RepID=A0A814UH44_9BILA|nr:unnamed protein product [Didymodactylos carnosus]CAF1332383.1 unnamed protein product [Didymodactylos carnosus]CAF3937853.1 unnamed protein product [Didymodactylos carnosus]CAF4143734.1 unnamed protein product [Didymodactylos carnosus]
MTTSTTTTTTTTTSSIPSRSGDGICARATWARNATTVAGGNGNGSALSQLDNAVGFFVDDNQTVYVADSQNHRIVKWERGGSSGQLVAGGYGKGNDTYHLDGPSDVVITRDGRMYIVDNGNRRILLWSQRAQSGEIVVKNISAFGVALDDQSSLYVSVGGAGHVVKWPVNVSTGQVLISGLRAPHLMFVDQNQSVYVADTNNHRVIKIDNRTAKEISIVAGGFNGSNLAVPIGVVGDDLGTVYVSEFRYHRITRWPRGAKFGSVVVGGLGQGSRLDQLNYPTDLSFDLDGNLYVVDNWNARVQKFAIDKSLC